MTEVERLAIASLIDALETAHHDRNDREFDQITHDARVLIDLDRKAASRGAESRFWGYRING